MNYGYGKTFHLKDGFTALNGCVQYYKISNVKANLVAAKPADPKNPTLSEVKDIMEAQANYLRVLETLRTFGGQPIITKVTTNAIEFTLEQANVYGMGINDGGEAQVSAKWDVDATTGDVTVGSFKDTAKDKLVALFANVPTVVLDYAAGFDGTEDADGLDLTKAIVEKPEDAVKFAVAAGDITIDEVLF